MKHQKDERRDDYVKEKKILSHLRIGDVDGAAAYIRGFSSAIIKNQDIPDTMCAYLERKRDRICCHAIQRAFNLRLSSNAAEKSNDLVIAVRQKHGQTMKVTFLQY